MAVLLQKTPARHLSFTKGIAAGDSVGISQSPVGTLCPKARGLSPQQSWESSPCVSAAKPCFPCLPRWNKRKQTSVISALYIVVQLHVMTAKIHKD